MPLMIDSVPGLARLIRLCEADGATERLRAAFLHRRRAPSHPSESVQETQQVLLRSTSSRFGTSFFMQHQSSSRNLRRGASVHSVRGTEPTTVFDRPSTDPVAKVGGTGRAVVVVAVCVTRF